jgi:hypothetical protein
MTYLAHLRFFLFVALPVLGFAGQARAQELLEVEQEKTFVYEEPSSPSAVVRRLYVGELVLAVERIRTADNAEWLKLRLGNDQIGFARAERFVHATGLPTQRWRPGVIARDEKPFGVGAGMYGESYGPSLRLRYLFFTRLGVELASGLVMDGYQIKGRNLSLAAVSHLLLHNLTPVVGVGIVTLSYAEGAGTLHIWGMYTQGGLEWMFQSGFFLYAGITFVRSISIDVSYSWEDNLNLQPAPNKFGNVGSHISDNAYYVIHPSVTIGFDF